ncbi:MAG: DUF177 domain-containing protein [Thermodesulfobacteriota bacterium]
MKPLKVEAIPAGGMEIELLLEPSRLKEIAQERTLGFSPFGPLSVQGHLSKSGQNILLRGRIEGIIRLECGRCLETFLKTIDLPVGSEWRLVTTPPKTGGTEDGQRLEELETGLVKEGVLDLTDRILEEVILNIPIRPLCRESCLGLCPVCGGNRNTNPCNCTTGIKAGPFSVLKDLRVKS